MVLPAQDSGPSARVQTYPRDGNSCHGAGFLVRGREEICQFHDNKPEIISEMIGRMREEAPEAAYARQQPPARLFMMLHENFHRQTLET